MADHNRPDAAASQRTEATDAVTVVARTVLLDALEALSAHQAAIILVGAQAVYLHTGASELTVAAYTFDGDLVLAGRLRQLLGHELTRSVTYEAIGFLGPLFAQPDSDGSVPATWPG